MARQLLNLIFLVLISAGFWFLDSAYPHAYLNNAFRSFAWFAAIYFVFKVVLEEWAIKGIEEERGRYAFKKTVSAIYLFIFLLALVGIWITNLQALLVAYGLIAAGVAISLQDFFKNIAGGIILFLFRPYTIGDRIEINSKFGDVVDMGILYTTLMEMKEWVSGDQATGRITFIPNGHLLSQMVNNYTKDHEFIWDEIELPVTYDSNWQKAQKMILEIAIQETKDMAEAAERALARLKTKYYITKRDTQPVIFIKITDNWILFTLRYAVEARQRRAIHNKLSRIILEAIQKEKDVKISSATLSVTGLHEVKLKK